MVIDAVPPAAAMLEVHVAAPVSGHPLALMAMTPEIIVDGVIVARGWGLWVVPVPPGRHHVVVHINRFGVYQYHAQLPVEAGPGARVPVYYKLPVSNFGRAAIGTTPQRSSGGGALVFILLLPLLLVLGMVAFFMIMLIAVV